METTNKSKKRKKSGAENRKASQSRREENERLGSFMKSYFTKSSKSYEDDASSSIDQEPLNVARDKNKENTSSDKPCNVELENEVKVWFTILQILEFDGERKVGQGKSTGPLSRYLQRVYVDFGKAQGMVESLIDELNELRKEPERIIKYVEQKHDSPV